MKSLEKLKEDRQEWYPKNKSAQRMRNAAWDKANPERRKELRRNNYHRNKGTAKAYYAEHRDELLLINRHNELVRKYGITLDEYNALSLKQSHLCAICKKPETAVDSRLQVKRSLAVDHCHSTKAIRGLLCGKCNKALGLFGDSVEGVKAALAYLIGQ